MPDPHASDELEQLVKEHAALRRVATLVASGGTPDEIFAAVGDEVRQLIGNDLTSMFRCEPGDMLTMVAVRPGGPLPDRLVGTRLPMRAAFAEFLRSIESPAGGGTRVTAVLPLKPKCG